MEFTSVIVSGLEFFRIYILVKSILPWRRFRTNSKAENRELALCRFELEKLKPKYWTMIYRKQNKQKWKEKHSVTNVSSQSVSMVTLIERKINKAFKKWLENIANFSWSWWFPICELENKFFLWHRSPKTFLAIFTSVQFCKNLRNGFINSRLRCRIPFVTWHWPKGTRLWGRKWNR